MMFLFYRALGRLATVTKSTKHIKKTKIPIEQEIGFVSSPINCTRGGWLGGNKVLYNKNTLKI